jgi:type IV pilus assembly protein PilM
MAGNGVWGIDVGQCALKALRCTLADDGETVVADAFDFIEYPKILSQPDADPAALIHDALKLFLSRNSVRGDKIAISVSGQAGLARFIKLPPVESKKIPDIVKYEARQQIPFALDEVIWDYQQMAGGSQEDGFALETEVGLFAMKREQVFRTIQPFDDAGMELDVIQLAPLCIYNAVAYDVLTDLPSPDEFDPDKPPESLVVLSVGTDTTDLVVTNGYRVWQRSVPLGGNHFTKQVSKELKLTFAKAEHLKRNSRQADDPRTIFQAMRPIFKEMTTEIQRSINYFQSIDRGAKIGRILAVGNAMKLPGLQPYLEKNLGYSTVVMESFNRLAGPTVVNSPAFRENILSYAVCYGLAIQGLGKSRLSTSLLPREILQARMIRQKKPWAASTVGALLLACMFSLLLYWNASYTAHPQRQDEGVTWQDAIGEVNAVKATSETHVSTHKTNLEKIDHFKEIGLAVAGSADRRLLWPELLKALNQSLPADRDYPSEAYFNKPIEQRENVFIEYLEPEYYTDLAQWYNEEIKTKYREGKEGRSQSGQTAPPAAAPAPPASGAPAEGPADGTPPPAAPGETPAEGPTGPGWVIEIGGYHFHNSGTHHYGVQYIRETLLKYLEEGEVELPGGPGKPPMKFTMKELGISHPLIFKDEGIDRNYLVPNPNFDPGSAERPPPVGGASLGVRRPSALVVDPNNPEFIRVARHGFVVQFCWQETPLSERLERRHKEEAEASRAAELASSGSGEGE